MKLALAGSIAALIACGTPAHPGSAADLRMAVQSEPSSLDPQFQYALSNVPIARHIYDTLVSQDDEQRLKPGLALSWKAVADDAWIFALRPGVTFHDGGKFTAEDVVYSLRRVPNVPNSPNPFTLFTKAIRKIAAIDPLTIRIETDGPSPTLPNDLSMVFILSKAASDGKTTAEFNSGKAAIGTGPYRVVSWARGEVLALERNAHYWGAAPSWEHVSIRPITTDGSRTAALLSGDVDVIEGVPSNDIPRLQGTPDTRVYSTQANRVMMLDIDSARDQSPGVTDSKGAPLDKNPMKDVRVRQAMSIAINREALVTRLLSGQAKPAGQLVADGVFGASPALKPLSYDAERARQLLADAGYPNGFGLTLAATNDRHPEPEVAQAIAQMLTRIGIVTKVDTMPQTVQIGKMRNLEFSFMLFGYFTGNGESSSALTTLLASFDAERGLGSMNRGRYSNPEFDQLLQTALRTMDDQTRADLLAKAMEVGIQTIGQIPLYIPINSWATRKGLAYAPRLDGYLLAMNVKEAANP